MTSENKDTTIDDTDDASALLRKKIQDLQKRKEQYKMEKEKEEEEKAKQEEAAKKAKQMEEQQQPGPPKDEKQGFPIFVGKLHPRVTKEQLLKHFECCGQITKCTIIEDHYNHRPKGYAYLTFSEQSEAENALKLNGSLLESQTIEVCEKRDNKPNMGRRFNRFGRRNFRRH